MLSGKLGIAGARSVTRDAYLTEEKGEADGFNRHACQGLLSRDASILKTKKRF